MADTKISALSAAGTLDGTESVPLVKGGANVKTTASDIAKLGKPAHRGCLAYKTADQTLNLSSDTAITFAGESYDTDNIHSTSSNTSRLTVPTGVTKVRLSAGIAIDNVTANTDTFIQFWKNGAGNYPGWAIAFLDVSGVVNFDTLVSPILAVTDGDYFEFVVATIGDTSTTLLLNRTWFAMEIIE